MLDDVQKSGYNFGMNTNTERELPQIIEVGTPATEHWVTDTCGHVVVRVSEKSVWTQRVEHGEEVTQYMKGPWPVTRAEGLLDTAAGEEIRWTLRRTPGKPTIATRGTGCNRIALTFGQSYRRVDYSS